MQPPTCNTHMQHACNVNHATSNMHMHMQHACNVNHATSNMQHAFACCSNVHAAVRVRRRRMPHVACSRTGYDHDLPRSSGRHYLLHKFSKSSSCHLRANSMPGRPACPTHTRGLPPATVQRRSARALGSIAGLSRAGAGLSRAGAGLS